MISEKSILQTGFEGIEMEASLLSLAKSIYHFL